MKQKPANPNAGRITSTGGPPIALMIKIYYYLGFVLDVKLFRYGDGVFLIFLGFFEYMSYYEWSRTFNRIEAFV